MNENTERLFEDSLSELERVVRDLEDGQLGLDEALARYEQGVALIRACQAQLGAAEQRILTLTGADSDGQAVLQPFAHEATARPAGAARAKRNGAKRDSEY